MPSAGQRKRISRIRPRAIPEVVQAFEAGKISARRADTLLYLPPDEQRAQLNALLAEQALIARRSRIAAEVIRKHLKAWRRDLLALRKDFAACSTSLTGPKHLTKACTKA